MAKRRKRKTQASVDDAIEKTIDESEAEVLGSETEGEVEPEQSQDEAEVQPEPSTPDPEVTPEVEPEPVPVKEKARGVEKVPGKYRKFLK